MPLRLPSRWRRVRLGRYSRRPVFNANYHDIVENERTVYAHEIYADEIRSSVSIAATEAKRVDGGTKFTITESGVFFGDPLEADGCRHDNELLANAIVAYRTGELVR